MNFWNIYFNVIMYVVKKSQIILRNLIFFFVEKTQICYVKPTSPPTFDCNSVLVNCHLVGLVKIFQDKFSILGNIYGPCYRPTLRNKFSWISSVCFRPCLVLRNFSFALSLETLRGQICSPPSEPSAPWKSRNHETMKATFEIRFLQSIHQSFISDWLDWFVRVITFWETRRQGLPGYFPCKHLNLAHFVGFPASSLLIPSVSKTLISIATYKSEDGSCGKKCRLH